MALNFGADDFRVVLGDQAMQRGDYAKALEAYEHAARSGIAAGQHNLAVLYQEGRGLAADQDEALKWYRLAAQQGAPPSQTNLGLMYYHGQGVAQDQDEAINWIKRAADQGFAQAEYVLGTIYDNRRATPGDVREALGWFERAAQSGHPEAALAARRLRERSHVQDEAQRAGTIFVGAPAADKTAPENKKCFIATAACGSEDVPEVAMLRRLRDERMSRHRSGRAMIAAYECLSPPLARLIENRPILRALIKALIVRPAAAAADWLQQPR